MTKKGKIIHCWETIKKVCFNADLLILYMCVCWGWKHDIVGCLVFYLLPFILMGAETSLHEWKEHAVCKNVISGMPMSCGSSVCINGLRIRRYTEDALRTMEQMEQMHTFALHFNPRPAGSPWQRKLTFCVTLKDPVLWSTFYFSQITFSRGGKRSSSINQGKRESEETRISECFSSMHILLSAEESLWKVWDSLYWLSISHAWLVNIFIHRPPNDFQSLSLVPVGLGRQGIRCA